MSSDIYTNEHRYNTIGKMSIEILLKDIGAQLAHIADELQALNKNLEKSDGEN